MTPAFEQKMVEEERLAAAYIGHAERWFETILRRERAGEPAERVQFARWMATCYEAQAERQVQHVNELRAGMVLGRTA